MDNFKSASNGGETPSMEPLKAKIVAPAKQKEKQEAGPAPAGPINSPDAKEGPKLSALSRPEASPVPAGPINLREAKEGLTLVAPSRPHQRPLLRPVPARSLKRPEEKDTAAKAASPSPHAAGPGPGSSPAPTKTGDKVRPAGLKAVKAVQEKSAKSAAPAKKTAAPRTAVPSPPAAPEAKGPKCDLYAAPRVPVVTLASYFLLSMVLLAGWFYSGEEIITAKEGTGYVIGIVGGAMMLLLILYPLRKTARWMRHMGAVKNWFRAHMILGLIGPALILFHANFSMGSLNSSVALVAMLLVALSGLVGRYIYAGIHYGLYGKEMSLNELRKDFKDNSHGMIYVLDYAPAIRKRLLDFDAKALKAHYSFAGSIKGLVVTFFSAMRLRIVLSVALGRTLRVAARRGKWSHSEIKAQGRATRLYVSNHISAAMAIARFKVYERLFSLWHILHMPLFLMLVLTAIIHVIAVHMF